MEVNLAGQIGVVTGAGSPYGIGRSLVLEVAKAKAKVIYACDMNISNMEDLISEVRKNGYTSTVIGEYLDVSDEKQTIALLQRILRAHQRFDFFFANAGYSIYRLVSRVTNNSHGLTFERTLPQTDIDQYDRAVAVMQRSIMLTLKYGSQAMAVTSPSKPRSSGSIVATSSSSAFLSGFSDISYAAVKTAITALVTSGALQLASSNIRVNAFAPGPTNTSLFTTSSFAERGEGYKISTDQIDIQKKHSAFLAKACPTDGYYYYNRVAPPEEMARIGVFLASDAGASINGQVILADSGKVCGALGESFTGPIPPVPPLDY